jgi:hypothetical protein
MRCGEKNEKPSGFACALVLHSLRATHPAMNDSEIDLILKASRPAAVVPESFRREVWQRIGTAKEVAWWLRPWAAAGVTAAMLLVGMALGQWKVRADQPPPTRETYLSTISPFHR